MKSCPGHLGSRLHAGRAGAFCALLGMAQVLAKLLLWQAAQTQWELRQIAFQVGAK